MKKSVSYQQLVFVCKSSAATAVPFPMPFVGLTRTTVHHPYCRHPHYCSQLNCYSFSFVVHVVGTTASYFNSCLAPLMLLVFERYRIIGTVRGKVSYSKKSTSLQEASALIDFLLLLFFCELFLVSYAIKISFTLRTCACIVFLTRQTRDQS